MSFESEEIYVLCPDKSVVPEDLKEKIRKFLYDRANSWYDVKTISEAIGYVDQDKTKRVIRMACKELLHFGGLPIASSQKGFCYATQHSIMRLFRENMVNRIKGMDRTVKDIDKVLGGTDDELTTSYSIECPVRPMKGHVWGGDTCIWCKTKKRGAKR